MRRVLFVCTGNTCRSPMAEALFRRLAEERGIEAEVRSAGVSALDGQEMSGHSQEVLRKRGIAAESFRSSSLTESLVEWADLILTMTSLHKRMVMERFPSAVDKTYALKEYAHTDPETAKLYQERESLIAEVHIQMALDQPVGAEVHEKLAELEKKLPDVDISDPIGGSLELYEETAQEIEEAILAVLDQLQG